MLSSNPNTIYVELSIKINLLNNKRTQKTCLQRKVILFYFLGNKSDFTKVLVRSGGKKKKKRTINLLSSNPNTIYVQPPTEINFLNNKNIEKNMVIRF